MKILAVDSASVTASVALCEDDRLLAETYVNIPQTHSETLMPIVGELLRHCKTDLSQIDLFAVTSGPGSFTGVRIGVAAVKGMALPLHTPCVAISSLEAAAYNIAFFGGIICAVMDARREQVYNALFKYENGSLIRQCPDRAISIEELKNEFFSLNQKTVLVGDGAKMCYNMLKDECDVTLPPERLIYLRASSVAACGYFKYQNGETVPQELLMPFYLRLPQAERELQRRSQPII